MISYEPFFDTMKRKNITPSTLFKAGFQPATYYAMKKGNSVITQTIDKLCVICECSPSEIMKHIPDNE